MTDDNTIVRAALAKFNQNKNAKHFTYTLDPGTYPIEATFTLLGRVSKKRDTFHPRRDISGSKHMLAWLLERIPPSLFAELVSNLHTIRTGKSTPVDHQTFERRAAIILPYQEHRRTGNTTFIGDLILEDLDLDPEAIPCTPEKLTVYGF
jgi:hypothetical protein